METDIEKEKEGEKKREKEKEKEREKEKEKEKEKGREREKDKCYLSLYSQSHILDTFLQSPALQDMRLLKPVQISRSPGSFVSYLDLLQLKGSRSSSL